MTDRFHSLVVTLEQEIREDDLKEIINAIRMLRCVLDVTTTKVVDFDSHVAKEQARQELRKQMMDILWPKKP